MRPSPNVSPQLAQPIAFPMTRKASTSKLQPAMSTTRSSLLHAPPMRDVWLDDDGDDSSSVAMSSDDSDCEDSKQANAIRKLKQKRKLLRRFGSKSERKGPTHHQSTMSISEPISSQPIVELKHTPSRSSMIAPQRSTSYAGNTHTRSSSATSRIMSFIGSNRSDKDSKQPLKSKISAPTNFVHHKHVDVDYLRGSSSDNRALRAATLQGIVGTSSSASSANTKSRPTSCLSSSSSSISIPQAVSSRQPNSTPKMGGHRHEDSIASVATTTNASTISHAASTPMTSAAPSPSNLSLRCASPTNLTPPPIVGAIDRKPSVESFGSWNATPNSEFFEQQNWLLSSTPDDALEHRYSHANPYSCYYHQSPKLATAITTNKTNNGTISRRPENYQPQRSSMLLPSPKLPVTTMAVPSVTQSSPRTNEGLGIGPLPENSSKILYEEKQDEDGFQWF
ncbi:hypothetical protein TRVA0_001S01772 [Trichomonascus vanleenenianus]|uniref:Gic2p n=1 Tax=Trichomonascus vanleenenianus TaxID=2268995 RepID=UPI003ECB6E28